MKSTIIAFFISFLFCEQVYSKNTNANDSIVILLTKKLEISQEKKIELEKTNKELKNQLVIYMAKEDYFAAALGDQSNRFVLIVSILVALLTIFSFSWYNQEKKRIKAKFKSLIKEFDVIRKENKNLEIKLLNTSANSYNTISYTAEQNNLPLPAFEFSLYAGRDNYKADQLSDEHEYTITIATLELAITHLKEVIQDKNLKETIKQSKTKILEALDEFHKSEHNDIKNCIAEIRILLKDYWT